MSWGVYVFYAGLLVWTCEPQRKETFDLLTDRVYNFLFVFDHNIARVLGIVFTSFILPFPE